MTQSEMVAAVLDHVAPITSLLDDTIAEAIVTAERRLSGISHWRHPHLRPLVVRAEVRAALEGAAPSGWSVDGDSRRMGEFYLRKSGAMRLRLLKGNPMQPGGVPHAGYNPARRQAWRQTAVQPTLPSRDFELGGAAELQFLLLWSYSDPESRTSGFTLSLAHTTQPGKFGSRVPCDLLLDIPRGGTMFEDLKKFAHDDDIDLFESVEVEIDDEAGE